MRICINCKATFWNEWKEELCLSCLDATTGTDYYEDTDYISPWLAQRLAQRREQAATQSHQKGQVTR